MKITHLAPLAFALGAVALLPACSNRGGGLFGMGGGGAATTTTTNTAAARPAPVAPDMVRQVQTALQQQGAYKGNIDGVWGPDTRNALSSYQQSHNLSANGELDAPTLAALHIADSNNTANTGTGTGTGSSTGTGGTSGISAPPPPPPPGGSGAGTGNPNP